MHVNMCAHVRACMHMCVHVCECAREHVCECARERVCMYVSLSVHVCVMCACVCLWYAVRA